jgi:hypothetical protein
MPVFVGAGQSSFMKGSDGVGVSTMTTSERNALSGVKEGQFIFNSTLNLAQYYDGVDWKSIDSPPVVTGVAIDGRASGTTGYLDRTNPTTQTIVISGSLFDTTSSVVTFEGTAGGNGTVNTQSIVRNNSSQLTVTVTAADFLEADDPYTVKVTNGSGLAGTLADAIDVNVAPTFATSADTNIGNVKNGDTSTQFDANLTTVAATDADADAITHTISAGSLPNGMSIQSDGTFTGTCSGLPSSLTVYTFTVQAATAKGTTTRQFKISAKDTFHVAATGGTVLTVGDYKTHVFTSNGNFVVSSAGHPSGSTSVEYLVVAGGGSGASGDVGGGGGAGGVRENYPAPATGGLAVNAGTYPITIGGGGGGVPDSNRGNPGSNSVFSVITSAGGGGGGVNQAPPQNGKPGGCGGGAGWNPPSSGGTGNQPPVSPPQGQPGGANPPGTRSPAYIPGGGGGAAGAGRPGGYSGGYNAGDERGKGGVGKQIEPAFFGPTAPSYGNSDGPVGRYFGGGGGASSDNDSDAGGPGGQGGGGYGGRGPGGLAPQGGVANTGGGSGGAAAQTTQNGGSGFVAIRYKYQ